MQTSYFQGKDGFVWWNGVVEDRKDPLFLGRCRVRILGWHTEVKADHPTEDRPWAYPLMPITSGSHQGAGESPIGPVEGTWVMGYYRDGELAQEPVMMGTLPGIPENYARQNVGFNDPRLDEDDADLHVISKEGTAKPGGGLKSLTGWPYPPYDHEYEQGKEANVINYQDPQRSALDSQSLYPRVKNEPTTSRYARGPGDESSNIDSEGIFAHKNSNLDRSTLTIEYIPSKSLVRNVPIGRPPVAQALIDVTTLPISLTESIEQPPSPYAAVYPFNHVYESESGHLVEIDDTPTKERLHWYHRSGTFTEFHPAGNRTDKTTGHHFHGISGNAETIIKGQRKTVITGASFTESSSRYESVSNDYAVISDNGDVILGSPSGSTVLAGKDIVLDARSTLMLNASTIHRTGFTATDIVSGSYALQVQGGYNLQSGSISMGTMGAANITTFGNITQTIGGMSEEVISNVIGFPLGNKTAKKIKTLMGGITLESFSPLGGIDLNMGPMGAMSKFSMMPPTGDITIRTLSAPLGITISASTFATLEGMAQAVVKGVLVKIAAEAVCEVEGTLIQLGGKVEPALKGKEFLDVFEKHQHTSSVGPTGGILPAFAMKALKSMSAKVFLG